MGPRSCVKQPSLEFFVNEEIRSQILEAYQSANPSIETSKAIVEGIAARHGLKAASVRAVLVNAGIYVAQPRPRNAIDPRDERSLRSIYREASESDRISILWRDSVAKRLNYQSNTVAEFFYGLEREDERIRQIEEQTARQSSSASTLFTSGGRPRPTNQYGALQGAANLIGLITGSWAIVLLVIVVALIASSVIELFN